MARIVYGVSGEGSGHSSRSSEVLQDLIAHGHEVRVATYARGIDNLADDYDCIEIEGLTIVSHDNRVSRLGTVAENLRRTANLVRRCRKLRREGFREFRPDVVITDFEPMTAYLARLNDVPLITVDNQQRMRYMQYEPPPGMLFDRYMTVAIIAAMTPRPAASCVTAFVPGEPTNDHTWIFPPLVRREVRCETATRGSRYLVYTTSGFDTLNEVLQRFPNENFIVYGSGRDDALANLQFRLPSKTGFIADLVAAKGVIATAGFTLISESLYLGKPYLALPIAGQFEQELNAWQLEQSGYGVAGRGDLHDCVGRFISQIDEIGARVANAPRNDGSMLRNKVVELVERFANQSRPA